MSDKVYCQKMMHRKRWPFREYQCEHTGTMEHEGKMYCKLHHPPTVEARKEAARRKATKDSRRAETKHFREVMCPRAIQALRDFYDATRPPKGYYRGLTVDASAAAERAKTLLDEYEAFERRDG